MSSLQADAVAAAAAAAVAALWAGPEKRRSTYAAALFLERTCCRY